MEFRAMKKVMISAIAILSAVFLALGCEWSGGSPDGSQREILEFKLPASKKVVSEPVQPKPEAEEVEVGIDLSENVPDIASSTWTPSPSIMCWSPRR